MRGTILRVVSFFLVTYALSWFGHLGNWLLPSPAWPLPMNPLGPLLAAPLVIWAFDGGAAVRIWWRRILRFRAPGWIWATAFLLPLAIIVTSVLLAIAIGTPHGDLPDYSLSDWLLGIPIVALFGPAPEEPGFRGYGQVALQGHMTALTAALWIGLGVAVWHLPLFLLGEIPWMIALTLIAVSVVYAWLWVNGGSIWPLVLLHWVVNYFGGQYFGRLFAPADSQVWIGFMTLFYFAWAAAILWFCGPSLAIADRTRRAEP